MSKAPADIPTRAAQRRERERDAARSAILAAALEIGCSDGWDAVTMRALADRLDYSANFAYRYFKGRTDILLNVARDGFARLRATLETAAAGRKAGRRRHDETAELAAVRRAAHAYFDFALAEPALYGLMYGVGGDRVPATDAWTEGQAVGDILARLLREAGDKHADRHVLQLWATAHGLVSLIWVGQVVEDDAALHELADDAITNVLARVESD